MKTTFNLIMIWYKDRRHKNRVSYLLLYNKIEVMRVRKEYTFHSKEEKLELVRRYLSGESPKKLYAETGISDGNIRKWKREYLSGGEEALESYCKPDGKYAIFLFGAP
jgi:hypothetical protein